eukprot:307349-Chlamydomonas_euryale.AAC.1
MLPTDIQAQATRVPCVGFIRDMCGVHTRFRVSPPRAERSSSAQRAARRWPSRGCARTAREAGT